VTLYVCDQVEGGLPTVPEVVMTEIPTYLVPYDPARPAHSRRAKLCGYGPGRVGGLQIDQLKVTTVNPVKHFAPFVPSSPAPP